MARGSYISVCKRSYEDQDEHGVSELGSFCGWMLLGLLSLVARPAERAIVCLGTQRDARASVCISLRLSLSPLGEI